MDVGEGHAQGARDERGRAEVPRAGAVDESAQRGEDGGLDLGELGVLVGRGAQLRRPWAVAVDDAPHVNIPTAVVAAMISREGVGVGRRGIQPDGAVGVGGQHGDLVLVAVGEVGVMKTSTLAMALAMGRRSRMAAQARGLVSMTTVSSDGVWVVKLLSS